MKRTLILLIVYSWTFLNGILLSISQLGQTTLGTKSPPFVTPLIKSLLRRRNRLARRGQIQMADSLSRKIGGLISQRRANLLANVSAQDTRKLWSAVTKNRNESTTLLSTSTDATNSLRVSPLLKITTSRIYSASYLIYLRRNAHGKP